MACSRGRQSCIIHTPDKERLTERLSPINRDGLQNIAIATVRFGACAYCELWCAN